MKLTRRFLSLLLALCLSVSLVTPALATGVDETKAAATEATTTPSETTQVPGAEGDESSSNQGSSSFLDAEETTEATDSTDSTDPDETEPEESTPAGTEDDPIPLEFAWNEDSTEGTATVTVPAETTQFFAVTNADGLDLYIDGEYYCRLAAAGWRMPAVFSINNKAKGEQEFALTLRYPVGSQMNPDAMVLGENTAAVEEDSQGYYFTYTAPANGDLTITMGACEHGWFYTVSNLTTGVYGDMHYSDDTEVVASETISVTAGDEIEVVVTTNENYATPAGTVTFTAGYALGNEPNPIPLEFAWNEDYTEATATVTVPAETTQFFAVSFSGSLDLYIDGEYYCHLVAAPRQPAVFSISNKAKGEQEFALSLKHPVGSQMNPDVMVLGENTANVEEDSEGYYFTFTAPADGDLTITMGESEHGWSYVVNNLTTYAYGDMHYSDDTEVVGSETISVTAGDEIQVIVATNENWTTPAGTVTFTAAYPLGSDLNPIYPELVWNEDHTEADGTVTVPAETTYYYAVYGSGMDLYVGGEYYCRLIGGPRQSVIFSISNKAKGEQEFELHLEYPAGSQMNPTEMVLGENTAAVEEDSEGYFFTFTAPEDGDLVITMGESEHGWSYVVNNLTTYAYGDMHYSDDTEVVASETVSVTAGDEIQVIVATNEDWAVPAGTVTFTAEYTLGHKLNPITPDFVWNEDNTQADATVTIPAETTYYFTVYADGMDLYVGGEYYCRLEAAGWRMPATFSIPNKAKGEQEFTLHLEYPVGSQMNPAEMVLGENTADVEEGSEGYFFTYIAPADGELTITMGEAEHGWFYQVSNLTAGLYGDMHYSDADAIASETISVTAGDEIEVIVATNENWSTPAGTVTFTAGYALGNEPNPIPVEFVWNEDNTEATATVTVPAETTQFFAVTNADGLDLYIDGEFYCRLTAAGWRMPAIFSIPNKAKGEQEFALTLKYPVGSQMNPAEMVLGENTANVEEDSEGYYYTFTAPEDGAIVITMGDSEHGWSYVVNNLTAGQYGDMHYSDDADAVASETISVTAGDEIQVIVATNEDWAVPAGTVTFTAEYTPGHRLNPITPDFVWNEDNTQADVTVTIPAETTYYFSVYADGMDLYVGGEYYCRLEAAGWRMPAIFTITNKARGEQEFELHLQYPVGSQMNPTEMVLGENTADVEEGSEGYFFTYIAPADGELTITMGDSKHGWFYQVSNITSGLYGDMHYSDADAIASETISVAKGDVIEVIVATNEDWSTPAGTVDFTASFRFFQITGADGVVSGKTTALKAVTLIGGKTQKVTWSLDNSFAPYASISASGVLTAKSVAEPVTVTVVAQATLDGVVYTETHDVTVYPAITKVDILFEGSYVTGGTVYLDTAETSELTLYPVAYPYGNLTTVTWKSSNTKVATVEDGKVTALKAGTVTITATAKDAAGTKTATVKVVIGNLADSVTIGNVPESLRSGSSVTLTAAVATKAEGVAPTTAGVTWSISSADSAYASVNASTGKVTAKTVYEKHVVTVVATSKDGLASASCQIVILPKAEELLVVKVGDQFVTKTTLSVPKGESVDLDAYVMDAQGEITSVDVTWTKSASDLVMTLDQATGVATIRKPATVTVTAKYTAEDGSTLTATVKVKATTTPAKTSGVPVSYISLTYNGDSLNERTMALAAGKSATVKSSVNSDATDKTLTWSVDVVSYDKDWYEYVVCEDEVPLLTVSSTGKLTASKNIFDETQAQTVRVTAASKSDPSVQARFYVKVAPAAYAVRISRLDYVRNPETYDYEVAARDITNTTTVWDMEAKNWMNLRTDVFGVNQEVTWKSSNTKVAEIRSYYDSYDETYYAVVYFYKAGTVTFTATTIDGSGVKASFTVKVVKNVSSIAMDDVSIAGGKSVTLKPVIGPSDATNKKLNWTMYCLDENGDPVPVPATVATLSSSGKLTTKATDEIKTVYVIAEAQDDGGCYGECEVTIYPATVSVELSCDGATGTVTAGVGDTISLDAVNKAASGEADAFQGWTWKSSNAKVATVDEDGNVTTLKAGTVTITATAADGSGKKATIKIVVK